jgi:hypothetical protein
MSDHSHEIRDLYAQIRVLRDDVRELGKEFRAERAERYRLERRLYALSPEPQKADV